MNFHKLVRSQQALIKAMDATQAVARQAAYWEGVDSMVRSTTPSLSDPVLSQVLLTPPDATGISPIDTSGLMPFLREIEGIRTALANMVAALPRPDEQLRLMRYLGGHGWHPSPAQKYSSDRELLVLVDRGDHDAVEQYMIAMARERLGALVEVVGEHWPARRRLIEQAVEGHCEGKYALSAPVFLAQADGICVDLLDASLFSRERNAVHPQTRRRVLELFGGDDTTEWSPTLFDVFLVPLIEGSSLMMRTVDREAGRTGDPSFGGPLNRHGVLHGLDLDYDTEANSLRAALVLDYLAWVADEMTILASEP